MSKATRSRVQMCQLTGELTVLLSHHHPHPVSLTHTAMKSCEMLSCHQSKHSLQADLDKHQSTVQTAPQRSFSSDLHITLTLSEEEVT